MTKKTETSAAPKTAADYEIAVAKAQRELAGLHRLRDEAMTPEQADTFNRLCVLLPNEIFRLMGAACTMRELESAEEVNRLTQQIDELSGKAEAVTKAAAGLKDELDHEVEMQRAKLLRQKASELGRRRDAAITRVPWLKPRSARTLDDIRDQIAKLESQATKQRQLNYDNERDPGYVESIAERIASAKSMLARLEGEHEESVTLPDPERPESWSGEVSNRAHNARKLAHHRVAAIVGGSSTFAALDEVANDE